MSLQCALGRPYLYRFPKPFGCTPQTLRKRDHRQDPNVFNWATGLSWFLAGHSNAWRTKRSQAPRLHCPGTRPSLPLICSDRRGPYCSTTRRIYSIAKCPYETVRAVGAGVSASFAASGRAGRPARTLLVVSEWGLGTTEIQLTSTHLYREAVLYLVLYTPDDNITAMATDPEGRRRNRCS